MKPYKFNTRYKNTDSCKQNERFSAKKYAGVFFTHRCIIDLSGCFTSLKNAERLKYRLKISTELRDVFTISFDRDKCLNILTVLGNPSENFDQFWRHCFENFA